VLALSRMLRHRRAVMAVSALLVLMLPPLRERRKSPTCRQAEARPRIDPVLALNGGIDMIAGLNASPLRWEASLSLARLRTTAGAWYEASRDRPQTTDNAYVRW